MQAAAYRSTVGAGPSTVSGGPLKPLVTADNWCHSASVTCPELEPDPQRVEVIVVAGSWFLTFRPRPPAEALEALGALGAAWLLASALTLLTLLTPSWAKASENCSTL